MEKNPKVEFDFNLLMADAVGEEHGVTAAELKEYEHVCQEAVRHLIKIYRNPKQRISLGLEWMALDEQSTAVLEKTQQIAEYIQGRFDTVVFLGIGGSFLGIKAAEDIFGGAYSFLNEHAVRVYFEGNNLDPMTITALFNTLDAKRTCFVVISKSGETTETKAAFEIACAWLKKNLENEQEYGRHIIVITDPIKGGLRKTVTEKQKKDPLQFQDLPIYPGVGGRFSVFNIGLLHLMLRGVDVADIFEGIRVMRHYCLSERIYENPALLYAVVHTILYKKKGKDIAVLMPFSSQLRSTADWYIQLLAESLGKRFKREISLHDGAEIWQDSVEQICVGRTPIAATGTNDLHSIQQNNVDGHNNKCVTVVAVQQFPEQVCVPDSSGGILSGQELGSLLRLAVEATQWALMKAQRPSMKITLPRVTPFYWSQLLFFFEMATAFEGELLQVNAYHQPGVESYKEYMYYKLGKQIPGFQQQLAQYPMERNERNIL